MCALTTSQWPKPTCCLAIIRRVDAEKEEPSDPLFPDMRLMALAALRGRCGAGFGESGSGAGRRLCASASRGLVIFVLTALNEEEVTERNFFTRLDPFVQIRPMGETGDEESSLL